MKYIMSDLLNFESISHLIGILGFLISVYELAHRRLRKVSIKMIPDTTIQIAIATGKNSLTGKLEQINALNILFTVISTGSTQRWGTYKFIDSDLVLPNGEKHKLSCRTYLNEDGRGQSNKSRNVPISLKGEESISVTVGWQTSKLEFAPGRYEFFPAIMDNDARKAQIYSSIRFNLVEEDLLIAKNPSAILTKDLIENNS